MQQVATRSPRSNFNNFGLGNLDVGAQIQKLKTLRILLHKYMDKFHIRLNL